MWAMSPRLCAFLLSMTLVALPRASALVPAHLLSAPAAGHAAGHGQAVAPSSSPTVRTASGDLSGVASGAGSGSGILAFKGIPFAAPPVGDLRWRAPRPPGSWTGVRKADAFGPNCMQNLAGRHDPWTEEYMAHGEVSEDCLVLNVWTPALPGAPGSARQTRQTPPRPVLVFLHGGAFVEGSGSVAVYDGEALARKGIVAVTINYRLGVLGFFAHPELTRESESHASGNYGLLDVVAALRWVQQNIGAFGGDPQRVALAGQSAGAIMVTALTASPLAKGLFQRAIIDSDGAIFGGGAWRTRSLADGEQDGVTFATARGLSSLAELRAKSWTDLTAPVSGTTPAPAPFRGAPVVDGYVLPAEAPVIFAQGTQNDVPTLTGINADELIGGLRAETYVAQVSERYGDMAGAYLSLYPSSAADIVAGGRDRGRVTLHRWATARAKTARTKVFTYYWSHAEPGPDAARYGAFHTSEVPYFFNNLQAPRPFTAKDRKIADTLSSYWVNFAATGDPNGKGLPSWPAFEAGRAQTMEVGERFAPFPVAGSPAKLTFFEKFLNK
jgi:para-nitrobenzyl esterase